MFGAGPFPSERRPDAASEKYESEPGSCSSDSIKKRVKIVRALFCLLTDGGLISVVGHHSHAVQGFSRRANGQTIAYSLGDFYFGDYMSHGRKFSSKGESSKGLFFCVEFSGKTVSRVSYEFTRVKGNVVTFDSNRLEREKEFQKRCKPLEIITEYPKVWRKVVRKRLRRRLLFWMNPLRWRHFRVATMNAAFLMLIEILFKRFKRKPV